MNKPEIVNMIRKIVAERSPNCDPAKACVYLAAITVEVLKAHKVRAVFQAGTSMWPRIRPEEDDGVMMTHFSYVWEPESAETARRLVNGQLPEMHAWAAIPATGEIIDLSTKYLPEQCQKTAGLAWTAPPPPDYLWADELPAGVIYRPDMIAIHLAMTMLNLHHFERFRDGNYCVECYTHIGDMTERHLDLTKGHCWTCYGRLPKRKEDFIPYKYREQPS